MSPRRKLPRFVLAVLCTAALALSACTGDDDDKDTFQFGESTAIGTVITPKDRKPAPDLTAKNLVGDGSRTLATKGKVVVLAFWASWCGPCRVEMPLLDGLHDQLAAKGVTFIGVDSRDEPANAREFLDANDIGFPSVVDRNGELAQKLGNIPAGLPFTIVLDKSGKVAAAYVARYSAKDLSRALTTLRAET